MCEFKVILDGKLVFEDAIYARDDGDKVMVKDVLGNWKEFRNCKIIEVNVNSERLILSTQVE